jgi:YVTN family beta-propeller protein
MKRGYPVLGSLTVAVVLIALVWAAAGAAAYRGGNLYGYVATSGGDDLVVFDLSTHEVVPPDIDLLPEGDYPYDVTLNRDGSQVWIAGATGEGVIVVDTTSNTIIQRLPNLGDYPVDVIFGRDGDLAYVSSRNTADDIIIIDTSTYTTAGTVVIPNYSLGSGKMAVNHCSGDLYAVNWYDDRFFVIDTTTHTVVTDMALGTSLWDLTIDPTATTLYIADRGADAVHVFDIATLSSPLSILVGDDPWGIDITPDGRLVFVANEDSHDVSVIDTNLNVVTDTIFLAADADPRDVDISADGQYAYVTSGDIAGSDAVYVIEVSTLSVVDTIFITASANTNAIAVAPNFASLVPAAAFTYTSPAVVNVPVQFTDQSSSSPTSWSWDFGDGGASGEQNPTHVYTSAGTYTVTLTVANSCSSDSVSLVIDVGSGSATVWLPVVLKE